MAAKYNLRYHIVLVTKYRKPALYGIENKVEQALTLLPDVEIKAIGVENSNHVHLVVAAKPSQNPSTIVARLKQTSHHYLWKHHKKHLSKHFWSGDKLWSGGYWASTIGDVCAGKVLEYVKKQTYLYEDTNATMETKVRT